MDSLYGGKQGISFTLKSSFPSVDAMVTAFKRGSNYTDVWYGEHCIIDTPNKNDADNGKLYRRGYDYQNDMGGAIYLGQIVGPSSGTPYFQMLSVDDVKKISQQQLEDYEYRRYPYDYDEENEQYLTTESGQEIGVFEFNRDYDETLIPGKYVEDGQTKYNDSILYTWCNVRKDNADADSWFYVGWQQPYLVTDYSIHQTSPYDAEGNIRPDATEIERIDDNTHPFYEHWDLGLPKGIKGDTLRNLQVIVPTAENRNQIYASTAITVDPISGETSVGSPGYPGIDEDIAAGRQIIVFDYYVYDKLLNPFPVKIYLGDFNIITDIQVADDGTLTIEYTHDDDSVFTKKIRWINNVALSTGNGTDGGTFTFTFNNDNPEQTKTFNIVWIKGIEIDDDGSIIYTYAGDPTVDGILPNGATAVPGENGFYRVEDFLQWIGSVNLNSENGHFQVTNNRGETIFTADLDWIKGINIAEDGTLTIDHTVNGRDETYENYVKWVDSVSLSQSSGIFSMTFNTGLDTYTAQLDWIEDVDVDEESGEISIQHVYNNASNTDDEGWETLPARLKLITSAEISSNGTITFHTNVGEDIVITSAGGGAFQLQYVENITLNTGIREDKHIFIKYNTNNESQAIGDPLNWIQDMVVRPSDWHLLVLYTDPTHRYTGDGSDLDESGADANGVRWVNNIAGSTNTNYSASDIYWRDMGAIKDQAGILIGMNVDYTEVQSDDGGYDPTIAGSALEGTGVCGYLQEHYPTGLTGYENGAYTSSLAQKIVTYNPPPSGENLDKQDKEFYAFDYHLGQWYYLGKIADSGTRDAVLVEATENIGAANSTADLNTNGLAFKENAVTVASAAMPKYWDYSYTGLNA